LILNKTVKVLSSFISRFNMIQEK